MQPPIVSNPPPRPLLIFDGRCEFCRRWVARWKAATGQTVDFEPYQSAAARFAQIPVDDFTHAAHLIEPDGRVTRGAAVALRSYWLAGRHCWAWRVYERVPLAARAAEAVYRFVAEHREEMNRLDRSILGS